MRLAARNVRTAAAALWLAGLPAAAGERPLVLAPGSALWIEGDSTLHAYSSSATVLQVTATAEGRLEEAVSAGKLHGLKVSVPVNGLESGSRALDRNLRAALKPQASADIVFAVDSYEVAGGSVTAAGALTIAGMTREERVSAAVRVEGARIAIEGEKALKMSDFGIEPPTMMLGAVKTDDKVIVRFRLGLEPADERTEKEKKP